MAIPWKTLDSVSTKDGVLELRQRGERDFLITVGGLVLMNSVANRSEIALGELACAPLKDKSTPRVLIGGLGMGCTLRAVIDNLPAEAQVTVVELNPVVLEWCRGPLADLTAGAVQDPRVTVVCGDVSEFIADQAASAGGKTFDAVIFDLYTGPDYDTDPRDDPLYGRRAIARTRSVLRPRGVFAVWGENYDAGFDKRLKAGGFSVTTRRPGRGGLRHVVYLADLSPE